jgi:hypothetical protein
VVCKSHPRKGREMKSDDPVATALIAACLVSFLILLVLL